MINISKKNIKKIIGHFLHKERCIYLKNTLLGIELKTLKETIRETEDQDDAWFFHLAKNSESIFDLGSNIGYMSLLAAIQPQIKHLLLVDPNPEILSKAAQNIIINGFGYKAKFITAFIGDKTGDKIKFFTIGSGEAGSMFKGHAVTAAALNSYYMVEQFTIDSLVEQVNYIPDLIKMDIEGAESLALKGAIKTASFFKTKFMIEMHSPPELPMLENATRVLTWCTENHYHAFYLKDGRLLISAETIAQRGRCHLLLLPQSETYPAYLTGISQGSKLPNNIK